MQSDKAGLTLLRDELLKSYKVHKLLDTMDGVSGSEVSGFNLVYLLYEESYNVIKDIPAIYKESIKDEYVRKFLNFEIPAIDSGHNFVINSGVSDDRKLKTDFEDVEDESWSYDVKRYISFSKRRIKHLEVLLSKLSLQSRCIDEMVQFAQKNRTNQSMMYHHFRIILRSKLELELKSISEVSKAVDNSRSIEKLRVKSIEEQKAKDFTSGKASGIELQIQKVKERMEQIRLDAERNGIISSRKVQKENEKISDKGKDGGAVCGCGLKVCIKEQLQRQLGPSVQIVKR